MGRFALVSAVLALIAIACSGAEDRQLPPWPSEYTMRADGDIEIQFAYPGTPADWAASVFIRHTPSGSSVGVNQAGFVSYADIAGPEGTAAICAALADESLMDVVKSRAVELNAYTFGQGRLEHGPCDTSGLAVPTETPLTSILETPVPATSGAMVTPEVVEETASRTERDRFGEWAAGYSRTVNGDVEVRFVSPDAFGDYRFSVWIRHAPSGSNVGVNRQGFVTSASLGAAGTAAICAVLTDESLMAEVMSRARRINAYAFMATAMDHPPCGLLNPLETSLADNPAPTPTMQPEPSPTSAPVVVTATEEPEGRDWPEEHRWRITDDVEVLFAYKSPLLDWIASIFMDHLPTSTWVALDKEGRISDHRSAGRDAMVAVCAILADDALMEEVRARAAERNPYPAFIAKAIEGDPCEPYEIYQ